MRVLLKGKMKLCNEVAYVDCGIYRITVAKDRPGRL